MSDNHSDVLQKRQPKTYAAYQNYNLISDDKLSFPDFSKKMQDTDFAAGVYDKFSEDERIAPALKIPKEKFLINVGNENFAQKKSFIDNDFLRKEDDEKFKQVEEEAKIKYPDTKTAPYLEGASNNVSMLGLYHNPSAQKVSLKTKRDEYINYKKAKIIEQAHQRAIGDAVAKLAPEITPDTPASEIVDKANKLIGQPRESKERDEQFANGVWRPKDEAGYVYKGLTRIFEASAAKAKELELSIGSDKVKAYVDNLQKLGVYSTQLENATPEERNAIISSDDFRAIVEKNNAFNKENPNYRKYIEQMGLLSNVSKGYKDIDEIYPDFYSDMQEKIDSQKAQDEMTRGFKHQGTIGAAKNLLDVTGNAITKGVWDFGTGILTAVPHLIDMVNDDIPWIYKIERGISEHVASDNYLTFPSSANREIYEDVAKVEGKDGKTYEAVVDYDKNITAIYDEDGLAVDEKKFKEVSETYDPTQNELSTQVNKMPLWKGAVHMGANLAAMMATTKGVLKLVQMGTKGAGLETEIAEGILGETEGVGVTTRAARALRSEGFQHVIAPRVVEGGVLAAQMQNDFFEEAIHRGWSRKEASRFGWLAGVLTSGVGVLNPKLYLLKEGKKTAKYAADKVVEILEKGGTRKEAIGKGTLFAIGQSAKQGAEMTGMIPAANLARILSNKGIDPRNQLEIHNDKKEYISQFTLGTIVGFGTSSFGIHGKSRMQKEALYSAYQDQAAFFDAIDESAGKFIGEHKLVIGDGSAEAIKNHYKEVFESAAHISKIQRLSPEEELQLLGKVDNMFRAKADYEAAAQEGSPVKEEITKRIFKEAQAEIMKIMKEGKAPLKEDTKKDFSESPELTPEQKTAESSLADEAGLSWGGKVLNVGGKRYEIVGESEDAYELGDIAGYGKNVRVKKAGLKDFTIELPDADALGKIREEAGKIEEKEATSPEGLAMNQAKLDRVKKIFKKKGVDFRVVSDKEFQQIFGDSGRGANVKRGEDNSIYLNKDRIINNTIFHEALHQVMTLGNVTPEQFAKWHTELGKVKGYSKYMAQAEQSAAQGLKGATPEEAQARVHEEAVVEFIADVADGNVSLEMSGIREALVDMYKSAMGDVVDVSKIGDKDLITFAKSMKSAFNRGELTGVAPVVNHKRDIEEIRRKLKEKSTIKSEREVAQTKASEDAKADDLILKTQKKLKRSGDISINVDKPVLETEERIKNDSPTDVVAINEASDALYNEYKRLELMKSATKREYTIDQISKKQEELGERIIALEDARGNMQKFQLPFKLTSPTADAINSMKEDGKFQPKAAPAQWKSQLLKHGAKQSELDWMGFDEAFKGKKSVTTDEVEQFIRDNKVDLQEVVKGSITRERSNKLYHIWNGWLEENNYFDQDPETITAKLLKDPLSVSGVPKTVADAAREYSQYDNNKTKHSQYTLEGGENYKEWLLTMPAKETQTEQYLHKLRLKYGDNYTGKDLTDEEVQTLEQFRKDRHKGIQGNFVESGHFDEPNIVVHTGTKEHIDKDGNKVLHIDRIQSDWAQQGRKKGYLPKEKLSREQINKETRAFDDKVSESLIKNGIAKDRKGIFDWIYEKDFNPAIPIEDVPLPTMNYIRYRFEKNGDIPKWFKELDNEYDRLSSTRWDYSEADALPDMPFKKTPQWVGLALERMVQEAAEQGFDKVTWVTGKQQNERWSLAKKIDAVAYRKEENGKYRVDATKNEESIADEAGLPYEMTIEEIEKYFGKEIAKKIKNGDGKSTPYYYIGKTYKELSGQDLEVGGEAMKAFYDGIVPSTANKLFKKYGAKVGMTELENGEKVHSLTLTPKLVKTATGIGEKTSRKEPTKENPTTKFQPTVKQPSLKDQAKKMLDNPKALEIVNVGGLNLLKAHTEMGIKAEDMLSKGMDESYVKAVTGFSTENGHLKSDFGETSINMEGNTKAGTVGELLKDHEILNEVPKLNNTPAKVVIDPSIKRSYSTINNGKIEVYAPNKDIAGEELMTQSRVIATKEIIPMSKATGMSPREFPKKDVYKLQAIPDELYKGGNRDAKWEKKAEKILPDSKMSKDELKELLDKGRWGMLTGENPHDIKLSPEENKPINERAYKWLLDKGYKPITILGRYDNHEVSFLIPQLTTPDANAFIKAFNQESIATDRGMLYEGGKYNAIIPNSLSFNKGDNYYSTIKINGRPVSFGISYDFGEKITPKDPFIKEGNPKYAFMTEDEDGNYIFYHRSKFPLDIVDPNKFATSGFTSKREVMDYNGVSPSMYYTRWRDNEGYYGQIINTVKIPKEKVYDANADPDGFYNEAKKRFYKYRGKEMAFSQGAQIAWINAIAHEHGYEMSVADWGGIDYDGIRAQTTIPHKAIQGELYDSNTDKGWVRKSFPSQSKLLEDVLDKVRDAVDYKKYWGTDIYNAYKWDFYKWTPEKLTEVIDNSDIPQKLKDEYHKALAPSQKDYSYRPENIDYQPVMGRAKEILKRNDDAAKVIAYKGLTDVSEVAYKSDLKEDGWKEKVKEALPPANITNKYELQDIINNKNFAILTGENPKRSAAENKQATDEAFKWVINRKKGIYTPITVLDGDKLSLVVKDMNPEDAVDFMKTFNQESVSTHKGIIYPDGSFNPIRRSQTTMADGDMTVKIGEDTHQVGVKYDKLVTTFPTDPLEGTTIAPNIARAKDGGYVFYKDKNGLHTEPTEGSKIVSVPKDRVYPMREDPQDTKFNGVAPDADITIDGKKVTVLSPITPKEITKEDVLPADGVMRIQFGYPEEQLADKVMASADKESDVYKAASEFKNNNITEEEFYNAIKESDLSQSTKEAAVTTPEIDYSRNINIDYPKPKSEAVLLNEEAQGDLAEGKTSIINISTPEAIKMAEEATSFEPVYSRTKLPERTLKDVVDEYGNNIIVVNKDMTVKGDVELPNGDIVKLDGGTDYLAKETADKVSLLNTKALKAWGKEKGFVSIMVKPPDAMLETSHAFDYTMSGINELLSKNLITEKEFANEVGKVMGIPQNMSHKKIVEWLEGSADRKAFVEHVLGDFDGEVETAKLKRKWINDRKAGTNLGETLPNNTIKGLLLEVGKDGRHYSKLDFYNNFAEKREWNVWKQSKDDGHLTGGFEYQAGTTTEPVFDGMFYGENPVRFDKAYSLLKEPVTQSEIKFQPASAKDEVRIKELADKYSDLPEAVIAETISKKSGIPKDEILKIIKGTKTPDPKTQVVKKSKFYINSDVDKKVVERETDDMRNYIVRSQDLNDAEAEVIMKKFGETRVRNMVIAPPEWLQDDVRVVMTKRLIDKMMDDVKNATTEKQNMVIDEVNLLRNAIATDMRAHAQALGAMRVMKLGTPETLAREINKTIKEHLGKKATEMTPEEEETIKSLKKKQQLAHEGLPKTKATQELENEIERTMYNHSMKRTKFGKILESIWYSNILSGGSTHNRNIFANFVQWASEMWVSTAKSVARGDLITPFKLLGASFSGSRKGLTAAVYTQLYGTRLDRLDKTEVLPMLEWWRYDTGNKFVNKILDHSPWGAQTLKHVGRLLSAGDALFYHTGYEMRAKEMAIKIAKDNRRNKPKNKDYRTANQILYNDKESIQRAKVQVSAEMGKRKTYRERLEYKIRVRETLERERGKEMAQESDNFAARMTFNYEPEGALGMWYQDIHKITNRHPWVKTFIPFARILTNVTNRYLDWTPYGFVRALRGDVKVGENTRRKLTSEEKADFSIKAMTGIVLGMMLYGMSKDENSPLEITANMTGDDYKNYQKNSAGRRTYSIGLRGTDYHFSYVDTPLFFILSGIGTINDAKKYHKEEDIDTMRALELAGSGAIGAMAESTWLMAISDIVKSFDPQKIANGNSDWLAESTWRHVLKTIQSVVVGNWAIQAGREWEELNHDPIKRAHGFERFYRDIPYVKNSLGDMVTAFGLPVIPTNSERIFFPFHSRTDSDPVAKMFTDNDVWIPKPRTFDVYDLEKNESYPVSDDELYEFSVIRGELLRKMTLSMWDELESFPPEQRKSVLEGISESANSIAKASFDLKGKDREELINSVMESFNK